MTEAEKTELLATMTDQQGSVLSAYLAIAGDKVLRKLYPFDDTIKEVPERYHMTQVEVAAYLLNKRGAEGETAHSENGIPAPMRTAMFRLPFCVTLSLMRGW